MLPHDAVTRRSILRATGGALAGVGATGLATTGLAAAVPDEKVEVNVGFSATSGHNAARNAASEVVRKFDSLDVVTIRAPKKAISGLEQRKDVRYVEENGRMHALAQTIPWGIDRIDAPEAHDCATGEGAHVAILDTGIDGDHPDLGPNLGSGAYTVSCNSWYAECTYGWGDDNGHGTHCAGVAAAADNYEGISGVAPDATLHAVKVLDHNGSGSYSDIAAGIEYVADQGWDVANLSLGGSASSTVKDACEYAYDNGVLLAAAAGNSGPCSDCVGYPAAYSECIAVAAIDQNDNLSSFSSTGPEIELAAPGTDIYSAWVGGGYDTLSGTSMATPHVSGVAALVMGRPMNYSNTEARDRLCQTAEEVGLSDAETGCGVVDAEAAVNC